MNNTLAEVVGHTGELTEDVTETARACGEILNDALATILAEQTEVLNACLQTAGEQLLALRGANGPLELIAREAHAAKTLADKLAESAREVWEVQKVAQGQLQLCLEDALEAMQSNTLFEPLLRKAA